jgi:hypothetical protein
MKKATLFFLGVTFLASAASAITLKDYKDAKKVGGARWDAMTVYVTGAGNGYTLASYELTHFNKPPIVCIPPKLALAMQNYLDILDAIISKRNAVFTDDTILEIVLAMGLQDTFPCKN